MKPIKCLFWQIAITKSWNFSGTSLVYIQWGSKLLETSRHWSFKNTGKIYKEKLIGQSTEVQQYLAGPKIFDIYFCIVLAAIGNVFSLKPFRDFRSNSYKKSVIIEIKSHFTCVASNIEMMHCFIIQFPDIMFSHFFSLYYNIPYEHCSRSQITFMSFFSIPCYSNFKE